MRIHTTVFASLTVAALAGCSGGPHTAASDPVLSMGTRDCTSSGLQSCGGATNGDTYGLVGRSLNGTSLDGENLDGHGLVGISFEGATPQSGRASSLALRGSVLTFASAWTQVVGATLQGELDNGKTLALRIDSAVAGSGPDMDGITLYAVSYQTTSGWLPFCGGPADGGGPTRAIALSGRWNYETGAAGGGSHIDDPSSFTFACEGYALAKCTELGYKPWDTTWSCDDRGCQQVSLAPTHQACTRALRADFCGDGVSYTVDGTLIDIYDAFDIRTQSSGWPFEAEWTESGARCAVRERIPSLGAPTCWKSLQMSSCGSSFDWNRGALIMTQDSPPSR